MDIERVKFCNIRMQRNIRKKNGRELIDVTTQHTNQWTFLSELYSDAEADSDTDDD